MGLDMYLYRITNIKNYKYDGDSFEVNISYNGKKLKLENPSTIKEEVGYWRKANHIHNWFVENTQDGEDECMPSEVSREQLMQLLNLCREVKDKAIMVDGEMHTGIIHDRNGTRQMTEKGKLIENAEEIAELLPTQQGFFFGSTDYDQYYMDAVDETIEILENALSNENEGIRQYFEYRASW